MTATTLTSPRHQELINIMTSAGKPLTSKQLFAEAKGFESQDDVSKTLNYLLKKGAVERELYAQNAYSYWPSSSQTRLDSDSEKATIEAITAAAVKSNQRNDSGNTLLRIGEDDPMPTTPTSPVRAVINDAIKPCPEIDAVTQEMADQAEIAYQVLSEALGLTPEQMSELTLTDLAATAAARLDDQPPPADVAMLASANRAISLRMDEVIDALNKAPVPFAAAIDNDQHLVSNVETIVAELISEQIKASEQRQTITGLKHLIAQIRATLDLPINASSMDILAEVENISRLADRTAPPAAQNERAGPYIIISDPRGAAGTYETLDEARKFAESTARRSTFGRSAIVSVVAEVELVPQWSDA